MADPAAPSRSVGPDASSTVQAGIDHNSPRTIGPASRNPARRIVLWALLVGFVVGFAFLIASFDEVRHWLALHTGTLHGGPDLYYNFWSGFGSDLGEATLISAVGIGVFTGVRKVNCHTKGCWRIGHHSLEGTPFILCRHHHPDVPSGGATHEHILEQHRKFKETRERYGP